MFYSEKFQLLYIAAPKTGSTSVEKFLLRLDDQGQRFRIYIDGREINSRTVPSDSLGHATANDIRLALGAQSYDALRVFGFVRHPIDKITSAYNFMRSRRISAAFQLRTPNSKMVMVSKRVISIVSARLIPFCVWSLLYPMKRNSDYYLDSSGRLLVDYLGATERLDVDLLSILGDLGVPHSGTAIPHENRSSPGKNAPHLSEDGWLHTWLSRKYAKDVDLYELARERYIAVDRYKNLTTYFPESMGLSVMQAGIKRTFDMVMSFAGLVVFGWVIAIAWLCATLDTRSNGFFVQDRVGYKGEIFKTIKIRTMIASEGSNTTVTTQDDPRITRLGRFFRKTKIDELPQLWSVLIGKMSFVGPRPDVPGFADRLEGSDRVILSIRPGITGPGTLKYRDEERLLASVANPEDYNREVIFPDKVRLNRDYVENWSFWQDVRYILETIFGK